MIVLDFVSKKELFEIGAALYTTNQYIIDTPLDEGTYEKLKQVRRWRSFVFEHYLLLHYSFHIVVIFAVMLIT